MNASFVSSLALLAASTSFATLPAVAGEACAPRMLHHKTQYPLSSQLRGQRGTVQLAVVLDASGRPRSASLHQSSGYRLLDRAATRSALHSWVFDVSNCAPQELPHTHLVAVEYHNDVF